MTQKQHDKHITNREPKAVVEGSSLEAAAETPDGLGEWRGGLQKSPTFGLKTKPTQFGDNKNAHGTNNHLGPKPITHRQDQDFCEIHTDANGDFWLYNVKNDKWDIKTDAQTIPFYEDENGKTWAFNYKTGAWDVPVMDVGEYPASSMQVLEGIEATKRPEAFVPEEEQ